MRFPNDGLAIYLIDMYAMVTGQKFEYQKRRQSYQPLGHDQVIDALWSNAADHVATEGAKERLDMFESFARENKAAGGAENTVADFYRIAFPGLSVYPEPQFQSEPGSSERVTEERAFAVRLEMAFPELAQKPPINTQAKTQVDFKRSL